MIPKLGLTTENVKSFEEAKSDDAGTRNIVYIPTLLEGIHRILFYTA